MSIKENFERIKAEIPPYVTVVAAAKTRTAEEVHEAIDAGITHIGENYVQEAEEIKRALGSVANSVEWHLIGHLQTNKVNRTLPLFDMIQTVDSLKLAKAINKRVDRKVPVLVEVNSGREPQKNGVVPEESEQVIRDIAPLENIVIKGLMTMGPQAGDPEEARPYFREMKKLFDYIGALDIKGVEMETLSMGMSNSYKLAIEEGSTMIRPGSTLFGEREA